MSSCAIFAAAGYLREVRGEIDHLADTAEAALQRRDVEAVYDHDDEHSRDGEQRYSYNYSIKRAFKHQKSPAQLALFFDLWRTPTRSEWSYAEKALLIVAYSPKLSSGWGPDGLAVQADGRFEEAQTRDGLTPHHDGRLLVWGTDSRRQDRAKDDWLFGIELRTLDGPEALERSVINPVIALLKGGDVEAELRAANLIKWPSQTQA